jgi:hypothetical protein
MGREGKYGVLVGKHEGKRLHVRCRYRWEDNMKMDPRCVGWEGRDWSHLAQDRDK